MLNITLCAVWVNIRLLTHILTSRSGRFSTSKSRVQIIRTNIRDFCSDWSSEQVRLFFRIWIQWLIQDSSDSANPRGVYQPIIFQKFCQKMHEILKIGPMGARP